MNVIIVGSDSGYPHVSYIFTDNNRERVEEIELAYQRCIDCMLEGETVTEIIIVYNGQTYVFIPEKPEKQLENFLESII